MFIQGVSAGTVTSSFAYLGKAKKSIGCSHLTTLSVTSLVDCLARVLDNNGNAANYFGTTCHVKKCSNGVIQQGGHSTYWHMYVHKQGNIEHDLGFVRSIPLTVRV